MARTGCRSLVSGLLTQRQGRRGRWVPAHLAPAVSAFLPPPMPRAHTCGHAGLGARALRSRGARRTSPGHSSIRPWPWTPGGDPAGKDGRVCSRSGRDGVPGSQRGFSEASSPGSGGGGMALPRTGSLLSPGPRGPGCGRASGISPAAPGGLRDYPTHSVKAGLVSALVCFC